MFRGREMEVRHDHGHLHTRYNTPLHLCSVQFTFSLHLYTFTPVHLCREAGGLYKLIIRQLSYRELTNFTCRAENEVGYNKGVIELTGNQCSLA